VPGGPEPAFAERVGHSGDAPEAFGAAAAVRKAYAIPFIVGAVVRLLAFPFAQNVWGDAPARADLAARWAASPGPWWSYTGVSQYGPLPILLGGIAELAGAGRGTGSRATALVFGMLGIVLAVRLASRLSGPRAGMAAGLALALAPMHVQASVSFTSEAFFAAFALGCVERALARDALGTAPWAFAAATTRYDAWLVLPLLALWWIGTAPVERRRVAFGQALLLGTGPASILLANALDSGRPFAPLEHVEAEHVRMAEGARAYWGELRYRLAQPFYWPAAVLACLTPGYGAAALVSGVRALRRAGARMAAVAGMTAPLVYVARAAVFGTFRPMARFAMGPSVLLAVTLPPLSAVETAAFAGIAVASDIALVSTAVLAEPDSPEETLASLSPVPLLPGDLAAGVRAVGEARGPVVLDSAPTYEHLMIAAQTGVDAWTLQNPAPGVVPVRVVSLRGGELDVQLRGTGRAFGARYLMMGQRGRVAWWDRLGSAR